MIDAGGGGMIDLSSSVLLIWGVVILLVIFWFKKYGVERIGIGTVLTILRKSHNIGIVIGLGSIILGFIIGYGVLRYGLETYNNNLILAILSIIVFIFLGYSSIKIQNNLRDKKYQDVTVIAFRNIFASSLLAFLYFYIFAVPFTLLILVLVPLVINLFTIWYLAKPEVKLFNEDTGSLGSKKTDKNSFHDPDKTPGTFPPELTSNYSGIELIGEGGFATVFKADRKKDNKTVAVKIPKLDEKTGRVFLNEVFAWRNLNHENIVKLLDANVYPAAYLETEYIDGIEINGKRIRDLEQYPKPVEIEKAVRIIRSIAEGLHHAHSRGVIHRDMKPSNVLIDSSMTPKITDFGLAKLSAESRLSTFKGYSPLYAAPEQIDSSAYGSPDKMTDIYQLGIIFFELLTGKLPYVGYSPSEVSTKIITPSILPIKPSHHNPDAGRYDAIVMKCLEKNKEDRFKDAGIFLEHLEKAANNDHNVEQLKKTLYEQKENLKKSKSTEEIVKTRRMVVETLGKLSVVYAESDSKIELLNAFEDLKFYTIKNAEELLKTIETIEFFIKNKNRVPEDFISGIKNLVHKIRREVEL